MNVDIFKLSSNKYAVSDDNFNIKIINANENDDVVFNVLLYENELESSLEKLKMSDNLITYLENNESARKISNIILSLTAVGFSLLFGMLTSSLTLMLSLFFLLALKGVMLIFYGSKNGNNNKLSLTKTNRYNLLCRIEKLNSDINKMKEDICFKVVDDNKTSNNILNNYYDFVMENSLGELSSYNIDSNSCTKRKVRKRYYGIK